MIRGSSAIMRIISFMSDHQLLLASRITGIQYVSSDKIYIS